jgi:hypothetical protein
VSRLSPNPMLSPLETLVGEWDVEVPQFPGQRGHATFEWLEGGAYLRVQADAPDPAPDATWIIGRDDSSDLHTALYYDSRGVSRVYQMSFHEGVWRLWRVGPGFWQRFTARLSDDGGSIRGVWEKSPDGSNWEHDFDMIYTKVR